jgi:hypothetical protein
MGSSMGGLLARPLLQAAAGRAQATALASGSLLRASCGPALARPLLQAAAGRAQATALNTIFTPSSHHLHTIFTPSSTPP